MLVSVDYCISGTEPSYH